MVQEKYYIVRGIQSWDFTDPQGKQVKGSKLYLENVPAKNGTVGKSFEEVKIINSCKEALVQAYGSEENLIGLEISNIYYDKYSRVSSFAFR